jgi:xylulose-5-phosphate/fructose-6-phosphate phosphoketolase
MDPRFRPLDAWWRAANYLSVGQIYLLDNPLLNGGLKHTDIKPRLLGHWGTTPGLNFIYAHLNRVITARDIDVVFIAGPGHGGPAMLANAWLEGTYSELYPEVPRDLRGMTRLFRQFSFPGGVPSHAAPDTPGSMHEGGELGYALAHAFGAVLDNPGLLTVCVVGDGEAETGPMATSWHSNKFLNPATDGAVLPILHLNGYKIANPTILARIPEHELIALFHGYGYEPIMVSGDDPAAMHDAMARAMDAALDTIASIQREARGGASGRPVWPMIILRSPKGWTGPDVVDGVRVAGTWRAHQVPMGGMDRADHVRLLEQWMRQYRPEELFTPEGAPRPELVAFAPRGDRRMSANPQANGGRTRRALRLPPLASRLIDVSQPGGNDAEATRLLGAWIRDVVRLNAPYRTFRLFGPDEVDSNRLSAVFEATARQWMAPIDREDSHLAPAGRVMEVLSEHLCQGWLEGYLLTGRHGLFTCYEAFIHIVDAMFNQHAKWLESVLRIDWRRPLPSLTYLLTSHVWQQDHNGFSHQDPGFLDVVCNKKPAIVRIYLPPDANTLLAVTDHCLRGWNRINVIVAGKAPAPQYLSPDEAVSHCAAGIGVWDWASNDHGDEPDAVIACAGDVPTREALAATDVLRTLLPALRLRVVNVVDLLALARPEFHPHGLSDHAFDALFTTDKPVIFAHHGYPSLIHRLTYRRANHENLHVHSYQEEGTTTTPFDMVVRNRLDRFHLAIDVIDRVPRLASSAAYARQSLCDRLTAHRHYILEHGEDPADIQDWHWPDARKV